MVSSKICGILFADDAKEVHMSKLEISIVFEISIEEVTLAYQQLFPKKILEEDESLKQYRISSHEFQVPIFGGFKGSASGKESGVLFILRTSPFVNLYWLKAPTFGKFAAYSCVI